MAFDLDAARQLADDVGRILDCAPQGELIKRLAVTLGAACAEVQRLRDLAAVEQTGAYAVLALIAEEASKLQQQIKP